MNLQYWFCYNLLLLGVGGMYKLISSNQRTGTVLSPNDTLHMLTPIAGIDWLLYGLIFDVVSHILSAMFNFLAVSWLHTDIPAPVSASTISKWLLINTSVLKSSLFPLGCDILKRFTLYTVVFSSSVGFDSWISFTAFFSLCLLLQTFKYLKGTNFRAY